MTSNPDKFVYSANDITEILAAKPETTKSPEHDIYCRSIIGTVHNLTERYPELSEEIEDDTYLWGGINTDLHSLSCIYTKEAAADTPALKLPLLWISTDGLTSNMRGQSHLIYLNENTQNIESYRFSAQRGWKEMTDRQVKKLFTQKINLFQKSTEVIALGKRRKSESIRRWQSSMDTLNHQLNS